MRKFRILGSASLVLCLLAPLFARIKYAPVKAGQIVELTEKLGSDAEGQWKIKSGKATFVDGKTTGPKVKVITSEPGVLVVTCDIVRPRGVTISVHEIKVLPDPNAPKPADPPPATPPVKPAVPPPQPGPQHPPQVAPQEANAFDSMVPSGYMGDAVEGDANNPQNPPGLDVDDGNIDQPDSPPACTKITYRPKKLGWAALAYLPPDADPKKTWGETRGEDLTKRGIQSLRLMVRGVNQNSFLPKVQFKSGGNTAPTAPNRHSYQVTGPTIQLAEVWQPVCIDLRGQDLSNTFSPLTLVVTRANNPRGAVFYIDTVHFSPDPCQK